ncbi:hypothetical protein MBLNU459_g0734t1 [Dothideomycetes sp. NU459]
MAINSAEASLKDRLLIANFSRKACLAALRGKDIPHALGHPVHRLCVVRGIRYHYGFGDELRGVLPIFTRALNARSIMSNVVPSFQSPDEIPYCIWHPETASEETYRELARRFPHMAYQVGRACAVAGYTQLYKELNILPDVHVAEEARECGNFAIFEAIMSQPVRYSIMNDYTLSINLDNRELTHLNGDTAVRWMLDIKQKLTDATCSFFVKDGKLKHDGACWYEGDSKGYDEDLMFDITEDMHIDESGSDRTASRLLSTRREVQLLYEPLPAELPTVQKDVLIAMAAFYGDVDRYARLRRPRRVHCEIACCVRGIYLNTMFAVWWSKQPGDKPYQIETAINARFVMNNVLSRAPFKPMDTPYLIWWPSIAQPSTYRHLAKLQPDMLPQIIRACIHAGYQDLFDELLPQVTPDTGLLSEAESSGQLHFLEALEERVKSPGITPGHPKNFKGYTSHTFGLSGNLVSKYLDVRSIGGDFDAPYNGTQCEADLVEVSVCLPDAWKLAADDEQRLCELDYEEWPAKMAEQC